MTLVGSGVYKVRESKDGDFPKGAIVIGSVGWIKIGETNCFFYVLSISLTFDYDEVEYRTFS